MVGEHYHELLWDYLYGLLDAAETQGLRAHVETCPECRSALTAVEGRQQMLARAARVIHDVPLFTAPGQTAETAPAPTTLESAPATLAVPPPRRSLARRYWPVWAAAAALLAVAFGLNQFYQNELWRREDQVAQVRAQVATIDGRFAALQADVDKEARQQARRLQEQTPPQLQVLGPAQVLAETASNFNVATRDLTGRLRAATITTSVVDPATKAVLHKQVDHLQGKGTVQVPPLKMEQSQARLVMEAKADGAAAKVEETLRVAEPAHASHLALNKSLYNVGEVVFFRALTLDRFSLKPPAQPLPLRYSLVDGNGRSVKELPGQTNPGGISGGELAVTPDLISGNYSLQVSGAVGTNNQVLPEARPLEIVREETPRIEFDRFQYQPGDKFGINFRAGQQTGNNIYANQKVRISVIADDQAVPQTANQAANLDSAGNLNNLQLQLPPKIQNSAAVVIAMKDGKKENRLVQAIPVVTSEPAIDFFPEGGDLVAGVPNRVYYHVRSPHIDPAKPAGRVSVLAGKAEIYSAALGQDLGAFTFTPDPKETYSVRITGPRGVTALQNPFQKLGIQSQGLVLHVRNGVSREGEALTLIVRNQGAARRLLLQTTCRGQIVDQQYVDLAPGSKELKIQPAPGSAGVLRVTALDASTEHLVPVAERLLFRIPEKRLDVTCQITTGAGPYAAGTHMALKLKAADERNKAGPTWMLAAVVDDKYLAEKNERSLATHFYLAGDVGGDDLDNANLLLNDTPTSRQALDLFLGTHGWRRFVRGATPPLLALKESEAINAAGATNMASASAVSANASFFSAQNTTRQNLEDTYQAALRKEVGALVSRANRRRADLMDQKEASLQALGEAVRELAQFQQRPHEYFRLAFGVLALGLLAMGGVLLTLGLVRLVRKKHTSPTAYFAGAFSCLGVCLFLYLIVGYMPLPDYGQPIATADAPRTPWPEFSADAIKVPAGDAAKRPAARPQSPPSPPLGYFVAQTSAPIRAEKKTPAAPGAMTNWGADILSQQRDGMAAQGYIQNSTANQLQNRGLEDARRQVQESLKGNEEMRRRYAVAESRVKETQPASGPPRTAPAAMARGAGSGGFGGAEGLQKSASAVPSSTDSYVREYAHRGKRQPGQLDLQDTLLWKPDLFSADGQADVSFDLSQNPTTYRILVYANSPDGRLGFYEGRFEVRPAAQK